MIDVKSELTTQINEYNDGNVENTIECNYDQILKVGKCSYLALTSITRATFRMINPYHPISPLERKQGKLPWYVGLRYSSLYPAKME